MKVQKFVNKLVRFVVIAGVAWKFGNDHGSKEAYAECERKLENLRKSYEADKEDSEK